MLALGPPDPSVAGPLSVSADAESADAAKTNCLVSEPVSCPNAVAPGAESRIANNPIAEAGALHMLLIRNFPPLKAIITAVPVNSGHSSALAAMQSKTPRRTPEFPGDSS